MVLHLYEMAVVGIVHTRVNREDTRTVATLGKPLHYSLCSLQCMCASRRSVKRGINTMGSRMARSPVSEGLSVLVNQNLFMQQQQQQQQQRSQTV